jgi:HEAT repeat protein
MPNAEDDPRSISSLFDALLQSDDAAAWEAVTALHWRGTKEVFDRAVALITSDDPIVRSRAVGVLGQLGVPERTFPDECFCAVLPLLKEEIEPVLMEAIFALQHIDRVRASSYIISLANHENENIRYAVAFALGAVDTPEANATLLGLMSDSDAEVRNWATFGVGQQSDADTDKIRNELVARLTDEDSDVRYEAIIGLGRRRDMQAAGYLKTILHNDPDDIFAREATAKLLGMDESGEQTTSELLGALQRLQRWSNNDARPLI